MKFSDYLLKIPVDGDEILLVGLHERNALVMSQTSYKLLESHLELGHPLPEELNSLLTILLESQLVIEDDLDELEVITRRSVASRAVSDTFSAILIPTMSCNLRCNYCFQSHKAHGRGMPSRRITEITNYIGIRLKQKKFARLHIRWFGGEPLLAIESMRQLSVALMQLCQTTGLSFSSDVVSNGTKLDESVALELKSIGVTDVQLTFDGNRHHHNKIRRGPTDQATYDQLLANIKHASKHLRIRGRIHVAPYNLNSIPELLDDFKSNGLTTLLHSIYFAPLFNYKQTSKDSAFVRHDNLFLTSQDFAAVQVELHGKALAMGFTLPDPLAADYGVCTALREDTVVINDDGSLAKCYMDAGDSEESFGNIDETISEPYNLSKWRKSTFADDQECRTCQFAPICLGGCTKQRLSSADKAVVCTPLKFNYKDLLPLHYIRKSNEAQSKPGKP